MSPNRKSSESPRAASGRVIVGVHGSRSSLRALRHAVAIALDRAWELEIVTVWPDADDPLIHDVPGRYIAARGHAMESQQQALAALGPLIAPGVETFLFNARPAQALIARCGDGDVLVVGAGRPGGERARRSVGAECVEKAPCAVTVVPYPLGNRGQDPETDEPPRHHERTRRPRATRAGAAKPPPSERRPRPGGP
jgi:nucleotide-binding universal stress UspA family protein